MRLRWTSHLRDVPTSGGVEEVVSEELEAGPGAGVPALVGQVLQSLEQLRAVQVGGECELHPGSQQQQAGDRPSATWSCDWSQTSYSAGVILKGPLFITSSIQSPPPPTIVCCTSWHLMYALNVCCILYSS